MLLDVKTCNGAEFAAVSALNEEESREDAR